MVGVIAATVGIVAGIIGPAHGARGLRRVHASRDRRHYGAAFDRLMRDAVPSPGERVPGSGTPAARSVRSQKP
jgi:hypothetical protein